MRPCWPREKGLSRVAQLSAIFPPPVAATCWRGRPRRSGRIRARSPARSRDPARKHSRVCLERIGISFWKRQSGPLQRARASRRIYAPHINRGEPASCLGVFDRLQPTASFVAGSPRAAVSAGGGGCEADGRSSAAPRPKSSAWLDELGRRRTAPSRLPARLTGLTKTTIRPTTYGKSRRNDWPFLIPAANLLGQLHQAVSRSWPGAAAAPWPGGHGARGSIGRALRVPPPPKPTRCCQSAARGGASSMP